MADLFLGTSVVAPVFLMVCVSLVCSNFTLLLDFLSQDYFFKTFYRNVAEFFWGCHCLYALFTV